MIKSFEVIIKNDGKIDIKSNFFQIDNDENNSDNRCIFFKTDLSVEFVPYMYFDSSVGVYNFINDVYSEKLNFTNYFKVLYICGDVFLCRTITDSNLAGVET
jgi:hypothetical protein